MRVVIGLVVASLLVAFSATAEDPQSYSPYAARDFATQVFWGDSHVHTNNSLDARAFGVTLGRRDAYRFARGEKVVATRGQEAQLSRPLDWLVVADHSDGMGAMNEIIKGNPALLADPIVKGWADGLHAGGGTAMQTAIDVVLAFSSANIPEVLTDSAFSQSIWDDYLKVADEYNEPGRFTAMIGYEWTPTENGNNLHRNVLYRDGAARAGQMLPYTTFESFNPEDLWSWMERYEEKTGGQVLAAAHNGNLSNGTMFPVEVNPETGEPLTGDYVKRRTRWEPLYEVTQIKGDGEAHPKLSMNDEFADYETWDKANLTLQTPKTDSMLQYEYAREALKNGLKLEKELGANPYQFGMIGATDSHTGLATGEEDNFFGKHSGNEPNAKRAAGRMGGSETQAWMASETVASGYAGVWATENTREALFDAMMRKEVYATTGPRMTVRFFGGFDYSQADIHTPQLAAVGYAKGVPMGGTLAKRKGKKAPSFLVAALKDPLSGNLDRIQIIKGWLDKKGKTHEQVYDVVWSGDDDRKPGKGGKLPAVGDTVNVADATWSNTIGAGELATVWTDPDFDAKQAAFYYARVIEIPTPRWIAYDAKRFEVAIPEGVEATTQERAYTSPIWYAP